MNHAPLAPSSAARTVACPGSVAMQREYPAEETDETRAGDAAHWAASEVLRGHAVALGQVAPNGVTLTGEMVDAAEAWAGALLGRRDEHHRGDDAYKGHVETLVQNVAVHAENYGTPDNVGVTPGHLYIDDFKFGHGYVAAVGNWQLINYAILWLYKLLGPNWRASDMKVTMTIYQPRCYRRDGFWRSWTVRACELHQPWLQLKEAYAEAMGPKPRCMASDQCDDCSARFDCEAALSSAQEATETAYSAIPLRMSSEAKGATLKTLQRAAKRLDAVLTGLEADVKASILRGKRVPGFVTENGAGSTAWVDDAARGEAVTLGEMLGVDLSKPGALTPLQSLAAFKKAGVPVECLGAYIESRPGSVVLVETENSRAAKAFGKAA
jgi:hypothetical protein